MNVKDSTATFVNVGNDSSSKTVPTLVLSGGSINYLNSMRSTVPFAGIFVLKALDFQGFITGFVG